MVSYLVKDLAPLGVSAALCSLVINAIGENRARFRSVRHNLKHNVADATLGLAAGTVSLQSIADGSAFVTKKVAAVHSMSEPYEAEPEYRYRGGQYLPVEAC